MKKILARLKNEPVAVRGFVGAAATLAVAAGVDTPVSTEAEVVVLALLNLVLFKGARARVSPVGGE